MKIYFLLAAFLFTASSDKGTALIKFCIQSDLASDAPEGMYEWDSNTKDVWNDSIRIYSDTLIVYKDPGYGYGRIISFTYHLKELNKYRLLLLASSMDPEGMFVLPEQYEWHLDTLELKVPESGTTLLIGPDKEEYKLNTTKPKLH